MHRKSPRKRSPARGSTASSPGLRRLDDGDVRAIFESLHDHRPPPTHLRFQIVPVGANGLKLSPPSLEFPDGLYVLLKPRSKGKSNIPPPRAPSHLEHLVMHDLPPETCPWSLSGPQFPQPTAIQQRYCYPKGRPEYSSRKGGALWTMYRNDGKEDLEYRLLHVYYSAKRAVNRGMTVDAVLSSPAKRAKRLSLSSPSTASRSGRSESTLPSPPVMYNHHHHHHGWDVFPPSPHFHQPPPLEDSFHSPPGDGLSRFHPLDPAMPTPSPFRYQNIRHSPLRRSHEDDACSRSTDPFPCDFDASVHSMEDMWNDPFLNITLKPSVDAADVAESPVKNLAKSLQTVSESIRQVISGAEDGEQAALVSVVSNWARHVAKDPLAEMKPAAHKPASHVAQV